MTTDAQTLALRISTILCLEAPRNASIEPRTARSCQFASRPRACGNDRLLESRHMPRAADESKLLADCRARAVELLQRNLDAGRHARRRADEARARTRLYRDLRPRRRDLRARHGGLREPRARARGRRRASRRSRRTRRRTARSRSSSTPDRSEADFWYLGCIDSTLWWLIALALLDERLAQRGLRRGLLRRYRREVALALQWLGAQEHQRFYLAAAERGQRLGRHHAALGLRAVHERAVVSREAALRPAERGSDSRQLQRLVPSVLGGASPNTGARACSTSTR